MKRAIIPAPSKAQIQKVANDCAAAPGGSASGAKKLPGKVERRCPRCGHHSRHWLIPNGADSALKGTKLHTARCTDCGHQWSCRVMTKDL